MGKITARLFTRAFSHFRCIALLVGLLMTFAFTPGATAADAWPALTGTIAEPDADPFYTPPNASKLASLSPGTLLRYRDITAKALYVVPMGGQAWQIMYRSTDHEGRPVANVMAIMVPANAPPINRKLLVYNIAYDARTLKCAPSYQLATGTTSYELPMIQAGLSLGWVTVLPDYEGLNSFWAIGKYTGPATLDAVRAAESFVPAGLSGTSTPVAITGYSGGSVPTTWANELYRQYAPELNIVGTAAGGIPIDLGNVARLVDGQQYAGLYFGVVSGLNVAYPKAQLASAMNNAGLVMLNDVSRMCSGQLLSSAPSVVDAYAYHRMSEYIVVPDLLALPEMQNVLSINRLGQRVPGAPAYIYNGIYDQVMPIKDVKQLAKTYCRNGVPVAFTETLGDHILSFLEGWPTAFLYLQQILNGFPATNACFFINVL